MMLYVLMNPNVAIRNGMVLLYYHLNSSINSEAVLIFIFFYVFIPNKNRLIRRMKESLLLMLLSGEVQDEINMTIFLNHKKIYGYQNKA